LGVLRIMIMVLGIVVMLDTFLLVRLLFLQLAAGC
jgi:hypothetical protein